MMGRECGDGLMGQYSMYHRVYHQPQSALMQDCHQTVTPFRDTFLSNAPTLTLGGVLGLRDQGHKGNAVPWTYRV